MKILFFLFLDYFFCILYVYSIVDNVIIFNWILNRYGVRAFIAQSYTTFIVVTCSVFLQTSFTAGFILPTPYTKILFLDIFIFLCWLVLLLAGGFLILLLYFFFYQYILVWFPIKKKKNLHSTNMVDQISTQNPANNSSKSLKGEQVLPSEILEILRNNLIFYARSLEKMRRLSILLPLYLLNLEYYFKFKLLDH